MLFVFILAMAGMRCTRPDDPSAGPFQNARAFIRSRRPDLVEVHVQCATAYPNGDGTVNCGVDWIENGVHEMQVYRCKTQEQTTPETGCVRQ